MGGPPTPSSMLSKRPPSLPSTPPQSRGHGKELQQRSPRVPCLAQQRFCRAPWESTVPEDSAKAHFCKTDKMASVHLIDQSLPPEAHLSQDVSMYEVGDDSQCHETTLPRIDRCMNGAVGTGWASPKIKPARTGPKSFSGEPPLVSCKRRADSGQSPGPARRPGRSLSREKLS